MFLSYDCSLQGLDPSAPRRLKFTAGIIHVDEKCVMPSNESRNYLQEIEEEMKSSDFPYHIVKLEEVRILNDCFIAFC